MLIVIARLYLKSFRALRRKKIYQQVAKFKYPEFSIGMPIPVQVVVVSII